MFTPPNAAPRQPGLQITPTSTLTIPRNALYTRTHVDMAANIVGGTCGALRWGAQKRWVVKLVKHATAQRSVTRLRGFVSGEP